MHWLQAPHFRSPIAWLRTPGSASKSLAPFRDARTATTLTLGDTRDLPAIATSIPIAELYSGLELADADLGISSDPASS